jgi:hypothetical protein
MDALANFTTNESSGTDLFGFSSFAFSSLPLVARKALLKKEK